MRPSILVAAFALFLCSACATPKPTGAYAVGRTNQIWSDASRQETMTEASGDVREVPVVIWYPAAARTGSPAPYFPGLTEVAPTLAESGEVSPFEVWALGFIGSSNRLNARLPDEAKTYPVIFFSPGIGTNVEFYDSFASDLASHGYVVVGLNHPYDVAAVALSEGKFAKFVEGPSDFAGNQARNVERISVRTQDVLFALQQLRTKSAAGDELASRLDLDHIGVMGHSLGGITAAQACYASPAVLGCLNLDGWQGGGPFAVTPTASLPTQPFMLITKEQRLPGQFFDRLESSASKSWVVVTPGADHQSFSDSHVLQPAVFPVHGEGAKVIKTVRTYVLAFFDQVLRGQPSAILKPGIVSDVRVEAYPRSP